MLQHKRLYFVYVLLAMTISACQQAPSLSPPVQHYETLIKKTIHSGMSQVQIIEVIGAPKVVQKGARGGETGIEIWLFDVKAKSIKRQKQQQQESLTLEINIDPTVTTTGTTVEVKFNQQGQAQSFSYQSKKF